MEKNTTMKKITFFILLYLSLTAITLQATTDPKHTIDSLNQNVSIPLPLNNIDTNILQQSSPQDLEIFKKKFLLTCDTIMGQLVRYDIQINNETQQENIITISHLTHVCNNIRKKQKKFTDIQQNIFPLALNLDKIVAIWTVLSKTTTLEKKEKAIYSLFTKVIETQQTLFLYKETQNIIQKNKEAIQEMRLILKKLYQEISITPTQNKNNSNNHNTTDTLDLNDELFDNSDTQHNIIPPQEINNNLQSLDNHNTTDTLDLNDELFDNSDTQHNIIPPQEINNNLQSLDNHNTTDTLDLNDELFDNSYTQHNTIPPQEINNNLQSLDNHNTTDTLHLNDELFDNSYTQHNTIPPQEINNNLQSLDNHNTTDTLHLNDELFDNSDTQHNIIPPQEINNNLQSLNNHNTTNTQHVNNDTLDNNNQINNTLEKNHKQHISIETNLSESEKERTDSCIIS